MKTIAVFCGSSAGFDPAYKQAAEQLAQLLASRQMGIVYGGARVGLMGALADTALAHGAEVCGIIPGFLDRKEIAHDGLTELIRVNSMHERKLMMYEKSDAVIALPGGFGTLDELFEILTWAQLGLHGKPIGLLNVKGYFDHLLAFVNRAYADGFLKKEHRLMLLANPYPEDLLDMLGTYRAPAGNKWITTEKT